MLRLFSFIIIFTLNINSVFSIDGNKKTILFPDAEIVNEYTSRIPFKLIDHLIVVEAELLNQKGNFIIDTGSETLILNSGHFPNVYAHNKKAKETYGVMHSIENSYEKKIKELVLQSFKLENRKSDVIDLSHIENSKKIRLLGIIGYNILKDYEIFIDMHLNQITLTKVDSYGNKLDKHVYIEKIIDSVNFKLKNHTIILNGSINDQKVKFGLDTAAEFNQINRTINKKALKYFIPKRRLRLMGASNKKIEVMAGKLHRVKLNKTIYFGPMLTVLTNLNNMNEAFGTDLDGVLGYEFFAQKRTIINYQKETLYFVDYPLRTQ